LGGLARPISGAVRAFTKTIEAYRGLLEGLRTHRRDLNALPTIE
jgi:hypothetical protein